MNATAEAPLFTSEDFPLLQSDLGKQLPTNVKTTTVNGDSKGEDPELQDYEDMGGLEFSDDEISDDDGDTVGMWDVCGTTSVHKVDPMVDLTLNKNPYPLSSDVRGGLVLPADGPVPGETSSSLRWRVPKIPTSLGARCSDNSGNFGERRLF